MRVVILPGNSKKNREWADEVASAIFSAFGIDTSQNIKVYKHSYKHWDTGEEVMDFKYELSALKNLFKEKHLDAISENGDIYIIAKSFGTFLAMQAVTNGLIHPKKAIFCGFPSNLEPEFIKQIGKGLPFAIYHIPTTVFQNSDDKVTSYDQMYKFITKVRHPEAEHIFKFVRIPANATHDYDDYGQIASELVR